MVVYHEPQTNMAASNDSRAKHEKVKTGVVILKMRHKEKISTCTGPSGTHKFKIHEISFYLELPNKD